MAEELAKSAKQWLNRLGTLLDISIDQVKESELLSFVSFAAAFPQNFIALVDTYCVAK